MNPVSFRFVPHLGKEFSQAIQYKPLIAIFPPTNKGPGSEQAVPFLPVKTG
jgi:hypothetical protein